MQQHILLSRKNKIIKFIILGAVILTATGGLIFFGKMNQSIHIECQGQIHSVFGDNQSLPEFRGIYTFNLEGSQGYVSVNGIFISSEKTYTVQRVIRVSAESLKETKKMHELHSVDVKILTGDNLPQELFLRYIFSPVSVITAEKTLERSYLIRNLYAPVLVCSES